MIQILNKFINKDMIKEDKDEHWIVLTFFSFNPLEKLELKIKVNSNMTFVNNKSLQGSMQVNIDDYLLFEQLFKDCKIEDMSMLKEGCPDYKITKGNDIIYVEKKQGYVDGLRKTQIEWFMNNKNLNSYCLFMNKRLKAKNFFDDLLKQKLPAKELFDKLLHMNKMTEEESNAENS